MSEGNRNNNGNGGYNNNQYDPQSLLDGLGKCAIPQNQVGHVFREKTSSLQGKIEDLFANTCGIAEIDHVFIVPKFGKNGELENMLCRAYFCTSGNGDGDIWRVGSGKRNVNGRPTVIGLMGGAVSDSGDFDFSDKFKKVFAPLCLSENDKLEVFAVQGNKDIASINLDFFAVMAMALAIEPSSPYNFSILDAKPAGGKNDYQLLYTKYIDLGGSRKGRHKNRRVNYAELDSEFAKQDSNYNARRF